MNGLIIFQGILALLIIIFVLLQQRSSGLGEAFGGSNSVFTSRRGAEKLLFQLTIIIGTLFVLTTLYSLYRQKIDQQVLSGPPDQPTVEPTVNPADASTATDSADTPQ